MAGEATLRQEVETADDGIARRVGPAIRIAKNLPVGRTAPVGRDET